MEDEALNDLYSEPVEESGGDDLYEHHRFVVDKGQELLRIDKFLGYKLEKTSRNKIQKAIDAGSVRVNSREVRSNYKVKPQDVITIVFAQPLHQNLLSAQQMPLNILFEDEALLIVNKSAGLVVHPGHGNYTGTLVNGLMYHLNSRLPVSSHPKADAADEIRPGLVHRIDKDTSGVMVIAKNEISMTHLARQFFDRTIDRKYLALVWGNIVENTGRIEAHIGRDKRDRIGMTVYPEGNEGKPAITNFRVVERLGFVTLAECKLETGRTHQIRVHMRFIGHPLFNDAQYGGKRILKGFDTPKYRQFVENCFGMISGQALHAATLGFTHPVSGKRLFFEAPLPVAFSALLEKWRRYLGSEQLKNKESGSEFTQGE